MEEKNESIMQPVDQQSGKPKRWIPALLAVVLAASLIANGILYVQYDRKKTYIEEMDVIYSQSYFHFDSLTVDSFIDKVDSGEEFIVIITRPNCPNCVALEAPIIEFAEEKGIAEKIYHLNVVLLRRDDETWAKFKETYGFEGTPTYARFADGKQVSNVGWTHEQGIDLAMATQWLEAQSDFWEA